MKTNGERGEDVMDEIKWDPLLSDLATEIEQIEEQLREHVQHQIELNENPFSHDERSFQEEHSFLEDQLTDFLKSFRKLEKEMVEQCDSSYSYQRKSQSGS